jgi:hypothetical protein
VATPTPHLYLQRQRCPTRNISLKCDTLSIHTNRPLAHQESPKLAKLPSSRSNILSLNILKRSSKGLEFGIGLWCYSRLFLFLYLCNSEILLYSNGLHVSKGGPLHYTVFGFCELGGELKQRWAMHIAVDGSSSCVCSRKRRISLEDITRLSVRTFFTASLYALSYFYFIQGLTCYAWGIHLTLQPEKVGEKT